MVNASLLTIYGKLQLCVGNGAAPVQVKEVLIHAGTSIACIKQTLTSTAAESDKLILSLIDNR